MIGKLGKVAALTVATLMVWAGSALADTVHNDVVADLDGNRIITISQGETSEGVGFWITQQPIGQDGQTGCNAADSTAASVTINVPAPAAGSITKDPSTPLSFTECNASNKKLVTFAASSNATPGDYNVTASVSDAGTGTYGTTGASFTLRIVASTPADTTAPTISISTPANNAIYLLNQVIHADYECADEAGGSGLKSCVGTVADGAPIDTSSVGSKSFTVEAEDNAGNKSSVTHSYRVAYNFIGFSSPVDNPNWVNKVKAGQAIPLKWRLLDGNDQPVTTLSTASMGVAGFACSLGTTFDLLEEVAPGGSGLQNLGDGYYQLNWKSPTSYAKSCKTLKLNIGEGSTRDAHFEFTK